MNVKRWKRKHSFTEEEIDEIVSKRFKNSSSNTTNLKPENYDNV